MPLKKNEMCKLNNVNKMDKLEVIRACTSLHVKRLANEGD